MIPTEDFDQKYSYNESIVSTEFDEDQTGMLETYGEDLEQVLAINKEYPATVWSMVDGEDDNIYVMAGLHTPAIYYVISNEEWKEAEECYLFLKQEEGE